MASQELDREDVTDTERKRALDDNDDVTSRLSVERIAALSERREAMRDQFVSVCLAARPARLAR